MSKFKLAILSVLPLIFVLPVVATAQKGVPVVSSISPTSTTAGTVVVLTINGSNFASGATVLWNGTAQTTTVVSSTQLKITVTSTMDATVGTAKVSVFTPGRNGGTSMVSLFTINPAPTTTTTTTTTNTTPGPLAITTSSLPMGTTGTAYSATIAATGGTPPYTFVVYSGALPAGLAMTSGGAISGTPTASGSYGFSVGVKDAASGTANYTYSTAIAQGSGTTTTTTTTTTPLSVSTASIPGGTAGTAYPSTTLAATGGTSPYTWSVATGSTLPAGLTLSSAGALTGTPTSAATFAFTAQVKDAASNTATKAYSMTVAAPATTTTSSTAAVATLPQFTVNTNFPSTAGYVTKTVCASGCNYSTVQSAINAVHTDGGDVSGELIELASGATFTENVTLPAYAVAAGKWIMVTTNTAGTNLPPPGARINPTYSPVLAKIITNSVANVPAVQTTTQTNGYWFMGLEIATDPSVSMFANAVFKIGQAETSVSALPFNIVIDRCYIHGNPTGSLRRGVEADGISVAVINSWISDFHDPSADTQAIWAYNTPGPLVIQNNELQAAGENIMFGAADPAIANLVPSDITVTNNHFFKPLSWFSGSSSYAGLAWSVKNLFEIKNAQRVLLQGNVFENNWLSAQQGFAFALSPRNASGGCTWCTNADVTIAYNIIRHTGSAFNISGADSANPQGGMGPSQPSQRINIHDNLLYDINGANYGGASGYFVQVVNSAAPTAHDIIVNHNTVIQSGSMVNTGNPGYTVANFVFTNNILPHNAYGIVGTSSCCGSPTLTTYFPGALVTNNAIENISASGLGASNYPTGNLFPAAWTNVAFVDSTNCPAGNVSTSTIGICALSSSSPYLGGGSDGRPIGADINGLSSTTAGVAP
ncbi:MAG TPA: putative Ig domain-containing protein [Terriglobia bacterium]|nr:putative Ig domain-containing protein [Terriglobia bacterium]